MSYFFKNGTINLYDTVCNACLTLVFCCLLQPLRLARVIKIACLNSRSVNHIIGVASDKCNMCFLKMDVRIYGCKAYIHAKHRIELDVSALCLKDMASCIDLGSCICASPDA